MNKKLKRKQALIMAEPYRTPFNSKVAKVSGDVIEDSVGVIKYATSFDGATKIVDGNKNKIKIKDGVYNFGKSVNLIKFDDVENITAKNGMTYSIKDGVITFSGTPIDTNKGLTLYFNPISINVGDIYSIALFNQFTSSLGFFVQDKSNNGESNIKLGINENIAKTWTVKAGSQYEAIVIYLDSTKTYTNEVIKPILVSGSTIPTKYYSGSYGIKIEVVDGVATCNGMLASDSEQNWWYNFESPIPSGIYSANMFFRSPNINVYLSKDLYDWANSYQIAVKEAQTAPLSNINIKTDCKYIFFNFDREHDYENVILKPMLVLGTIAPTEFEPNFKNLLELEDTKETTVGNFKYSIKNGIVTIDGTTNGTYSVIYTQDIQNLLEDGATYSFNDISNNNYFYMQIGLVKIDGSTQYLTKKNSFTWSTSVYSRCNVKIQSNNVATPFDNLEIKPTLVKSTIIPSQFIPFANPYFISLGQNGSVQYNGLEPREIDLKGNVISKINNQASDKLSNYALTKNTKVVDLGSLTWDVVPTSQANIIRYRSVDLRYEAVFPTSNDTIANILCVKYDTVSRNDSYERLIKGISLDYQYSLIIYDPEYNTSDKLEAFKKAIRGVLLMYQVKNPTTINTTSFKTFKEDTNATISDDNFTSSPNVITETFKPTRSYDFKVNGFSNVVKSENILKLPNLEETNGGVTYSVKDNVITLNGTATDDYWIWIYFDKTLNGTYSFNCFDKNSITYSPNVRISLYDLTTEVIVANLSNSQTTSTIELNNYNCKRLGIRKVKGQVFNNTIYKLMLTEGNKIPTTFEPYFDPYIESFADKKNLLELPIKSGTINNVSYNISQGNVLTLNGTMSNASNYVMVNDLNLVLEKGIYTFAITKTMLINNVSCAIILGTTDGDLIFTIQGGNTSITTILPSKTTINYLRMWINPTTFNNYQIRLMLIQGKTAPTTFLPYQDKYSAFLNVEGKNLLEFDDQSGTIPAGVSYNVKNQIITLNGTAKVDGWVWFPFETTLNGTYSFKVITSKPISSSTTNKARISLDNPGIAGQVLVYLHQSLETTVELTNFTCKRIGINSPINETWDDMQFLLILVEGDQIPEYEPYYSFTKEVLINQPLRKFDYLTYDGVYRQTNEIVLDGTNNIYVDDKGKIFLLKIPNADSVGKNWLVNVASEIMVTTSNLPLLPYYNISNYNQMGIGTNQGNIILRLDDSADNSLNNWTVEKVNNYFKQNPITITYKTVDQTFEATSLTRLLFKNGYNKITAFDSINNNAIVEYLEYYKSKGD